MYKNSCFKIRKFKSSDLDTVRDLIHKTIDINYPSVYSDEAIKYFKDYHNNKNILKAAKEGYTVVLEKDNRLIGTATLIDGYITRVFVNPELTAVQFVPLSVETKTPLAAPANRFVPPAPLEETAKP